MIDFRFSETYYENANCVLCQTKQSRNLVISAKNVIKENIKERKGQNLNPQIKTQVRLEVRTRKQNISVRA